MQASVAYVAAHELVESRLIDRNDALLQSLYLGAVDVDAGDIRAHFGEAGSRNEPYISGSNDGDLHLA